MRRWPALRGGGGGGVVALLLLLLCATLATAAPCDVASWTNGTWSFVRGDGAAFARRRAVEAFVRAHMATFASKSDPAAWQWAPAACELDVASAAGLCGPLRAAAGGRGVLALGDSLSKSFTLSLAGALGATPAALSARELALGVGRTSGKGGNALSFEVCAGGGGSGGPNGTTAALRLTYIRTDVLSTRLDGFKAHPGMGDIYSEPWADPALLADYGVVVVNSGAHHVTDGPFSQHMAAAAAFLNASVARPRLLVARSTVPGHGQCASLGRPFRSLVGAEKYVAGHPYFSSGTTAAQNRLAAPLFAAAGFVPLDVYTPTVQRGDGHVSGADCLHYRLPGPVDAWVDALAMVVRAAAAAAAAAAAGGAAAGAGAGAAAAAAGGAAAAAAAAAGGKAGAGAAAVAAAGGAAGAAGAAAAAAAAAAAPPPSGGPNGTAAR